MTFDEEQLGSIRLLLEVAARRVAYADQATLDVMARRIAYCADTLNGQAPTPRARAVNGLQLTGTEAASLLATELRSVFSVGDIEPLFQLHRWLTQLDILTFQIDGPSLGGGSCLWRDVACLFISSSRVEDVLYLYARGIADLIRFRTRANRKSRAALYPCSPALYDLKGSAESFSDVFALELLVPKTGFGIALKKVRDLLQVSSATIGDVELLYLSRIFGVSFFSMAKRSERLGLLPSGGAKAMLEFMDGNFGGPEARANALGLPPRPQVHVCQVPESVLSRVARQIRDGVVVGSEIAAQLAIPSQLILQAIPGASEGSNRFWQ